ncbi:MULTISPECIES: ABC transporter ATP-binding protein [unclassified Paenibacillus]|uniref:ABC transporter ATP-binding protein n=1 Tax=unclassified Paenibacillus TaxID=185978 RepID=UPI0036309C32
MTSIQTEHIELHVGSFQLHDISVSIPAGKVTAIVGPNGSGKSTLLKIITQLLQADKGNVLINSKPVKEYKTLELAQTLAMLTQSKHSLPDLTVRELITYGRSPYKRLFDRITSDDTNIIDWAMEVTSTKKHENRMFHTLSGGEQQKARIAMALAQQTTIILLDEPTTFLDIAHQLDVMEMLQKINQEFKITIVMVLHDLQQAASYCDYLIAMKNGKIKVTGKPGEIISSHFLEDVYNIEAKVTFVDTYPIIIPIKTLK